MVQADLHRNVVSKAQVRLHLPHGATCVAPLNAIFGLSAARLLAVHHSTDATEAIGHLFALNSLA